MINTLCLTTGNKMEIIILSGETIARNSIAL
jgi:hypothetical protein